LQIGGRKDPARRDLLNSNVLREFDLRDIIAKIPINAW
jgi:hypothetical protein